MVILKNIFYPQRALEELFSSGCLPIPQPGPPALGIAACPGKKPAPFDFGVSHWLRSQADGL